MRATIYLLLALGFGAIAAICNGDEAAKASYVYIAESVMLGGDAPEPEPEPDSDICDNCNGRGKVGDGTVMVTCPVCDGTGKKKKAQDLPITDTIVDGWPPKELVQSPVEQKHALVEIFSRDNCVYCDRLKALIPSMQSQGWSVVVHEGSSGMVPRSHIWVNGQISVVAGFGGRSAFFGALRRASEKHSSRGVQSATMDSYTPRWTWPGDLYSHLLRPPHSIDTAAWTQDQRERYHDDWHDRFGSD